MTRQEMLQKMTERLSQAGVESAAYDSRALLEWILNIDRSEFYMNPMQGLTEEEERRLDETLELRRKRVPLQYIMKEAQFMGYSFYVDENVLIPRFDTECLVEYVTQRIGNDSKEVLDLCCGSGCIGISIKKLCSGCSVTLSDLSEGALAVSKRNAKELDVQVEIIHSDLFKEHEGRIYDEIVSNPPYICSEIIKGLMPEVRDHEPMMALDGTEDGLHFYRQIISRAGQHLKEGGYLSFEIGAEQGEAVKNIMLENNFCQVIVKKDLAGLDRIVSGMKR